MLQKFINRWLIKRHFWRYVGFDELSEIYTSMFMRSLALSVIGIFVPIYLYKIGYSLTSIFFMYTIWFLVRLVISPLSAKIVGLFGPKHSIAFATVAHIVFLTMLLTIQDFRWPLFVLAIVGSFAYCLFVLAFEVDFSKVKHTEHGGKELGYEQIFERVGAALGPLIGGLIATLVNPRYTIALAIVVLCASLVPIFMSAEPVHIHQKITFKGFPFKRVKYDLISATALGLENTVTVLVWPIFIAVVILTEDTFLKIGILTSISTIVALLATYSIGKLIDEQKGRMLLNAGAICNAILHLFRPLVTNIGQILGINLVNEPLTVAYRMPYIKGRFDASDQLVGYRIIYFVANDMALAMANTVFWAALWISSIFINPVTVMKYSFIAGAVFSLFIMTQRFTSLRS